MVLCEFLGDTNSNSALSHLHISDSMDALEAVKPLMFADITVSTVERIRLFTVDIVWFEVVFKLYIYFLCENLFNMWLIKLHLILLVCCVGCHRAQFWDQ